MRYKAYQGEVFEAANATAVLQYLRSTDWTKSDEPMETYLEAMVKRVQDQTGAIIATDSHETIVNGLVNAGLLKEQR